MRIDIVSYQVVAIHKAANGRIDVASSVIFEGRLAEIGGEGTVGNPPCSFIELLDSLFPSFQLGLLLFRV